MLGLRAVSETALCELLPTFFTIAEETTTRYGTHSFATRATDVPAHTLIPGRINRGMQIGRSLSDGGEGQFGALIRSRFSEIELNNTDGALDSLVDDSFVDGRQMRLKIGATETDDHGREYVQPYEDFVLVYSAVSGIWSAEHNILRLRVQDRGSLLQDRLQSISYGGGGGPSGSPELTGRSVPISLGRCLNVTAQLVDPSRLTYQVHDSSIDSLTAVYDRGISIPSSGTDYARYRDLEKATVPAGTYATALFDGVFRLGSTPTGTVTADVRGDNNGGYVDGHGGVMKRILLQYTKLGAARIDSESFATLDAVQPATMGIFFPAGDQSTVEQALERVAFSCGAFAGQDRSGLYRVQRLESPPATPDWAFDGRHITAIERLALPYGVPWRGWGVGFQVNWTVQRSSELATGVSQPRRVFLEADRRYAFAQNPDIAIGHLTSSGAPLRPSLFLAKEDAQAEAQRLLLFYALRRALYRVTVKNVLFSVQIGHSVRLTYPRWNLVSGVNHVVVGVDDDADSVETELLVFG